MSATFSASKETKALTTSPGFERWVVEWGELAVASGAISVDTKSQHVSSETSQRSASCRKFPWLQLLLCHGQYTLIKEWHAAYLEEKVHKDCHHRLETCVGVLIDRRGGSEQITLQ